MTTSIAELGEERFKKILDKLSFYSCAECGAELMLSHDEKGNSAFDCTRNWKHTGIAKEASPYQQRGDESLNILSRREKMVEQLGKEKATALAKYEGVTSLTKEDANEILTTIYPKAPEVEVKRAMLLCAGYNLNPLMGHLFLIPFKTKDGQTWATVLGIKAKRLLANRRGSISYVDDTPRLMSEAEQTKIYGKVDSNYIYAITVLRDPSTNAEARGYGKWRVGDSVYGTDKGNSAENMAFIRSEAQALDRLRPGEMPVGVEVVDEKFVPKAEPDFLEGEFSEVKEPEKPKPKPKKTPPAKEPEVAEPDDNPSQMTLQELLELAKEKGWSLTDIGQYCNKELGWKVTTREDINTPERINTLAKYISENPK